MQVKFRTNAWIDGYRFRQGIQQVPDHLRNRLPKTAKILDDEPKAAPAVAVKAKAPEAPQVEPPQSDEKPKAYAGVQSHFKDDGGANVTKEEVLNAAVREFIAESMGNDVPAWNSLDQNERKERMQNVAKIMLQSL